jgi:hypothetical protein
MTTHKTAESKPIKYAHWIDEGAYTDTSDKHVFMCSNCCAHVIEYPEDIAIQRHCYHCGLFMWNGEN